MSNKNRDPHKDSFYDSVASKYDYTNNYGPADIGSHSNYRSVTRIHMELLGVIDCIRKESGFNINAPPSRFEKARKLFAELRDKIDRRLDSEENNEIISEAKWALFQKFDHMEAISILKRMKI